MAGVAHSVAIVSWINMPASHSLNTFSTKTAGSLILLSQMQHCKLKGFMKAFIARLISVQMNNLLSVKINLLTESLELQRHITS